MTVAMYTSTTADGSMKPLVEADKPAVLATRQTFLKQHDLSADDTVLVNLIYQGDDYCRYETVGAEQKGDGIVREAPFIMDGLVTKERGVALLLPLADCIGAVLYDPTREVLMLSHLGRHNLEQYGGTKSVEYLVSRHGVDPSSLEVWLSPAAGKDTYPLFAFDNRSMHDVATEQLVAAGVRREAIEASPIDTAKDMNYFSHSEFLQGNRDTDGRFAVVTVMR